MQLFLSLIKCYLLQKKLYVALELNYYFAQMHDILCINGRFKSISDFYFIEFEIAERHFRSLVIGQSVFRQNIVLLHDVKMKPRHNYKLSRKNKFQSCICMLIKSVPLYA